MSPASKCLPFPGPSVILGDTGQAIQIPFVRQVALALEKGPLAADAKVARLEPVLGDVKKTTEALAEGLGRATGGKRRPPSKRLRDAVGECAAAFNSVHDEIAWFARKAPAGPDRDHLLALLAPMEALLARSTPVTETPAETGSASPPAVRPAAPDGATPA